MKLTILRVKKWLVVLGIIFPILLIQIATSSAVSSIFEKSLIETREETLNMLVTSFKDTLSEYSDLTTSLNALKNLEETQEIIEDNAQIELLISSNRENDITTRQKILNLLKSGDIVLDQTKEYLYFTDYNLKNNRIIALKKKLSDITTHVTQINEDQISMGIYMEDQLIYHTDRYISFDQVNNVNAEVKEAQGHQFLVMSQEVESLNAQVFVLYDITQDLLKVRMNIIRYSLIMILILVFVGYVFYRNSPFGKDDIGYLISQTKGILRMLKSKQVETMTFDTTKVAFDSTLEIDYNKSKKIIKSINDLENQISLLKLEHMQLKMDQEILESTLTNVTLENSISKRIRDEFTDFVDQILITVDRQLIVTDVNRVFIQKMGYRKDDVVGRSLSEFIVEEVDDEMYNNIKTISDDLVFLNLLHKTQKESISEFVSLKTIYWNEDDVLLIGKSIHEEISLQSRILRKNRELEYINQINSSLISNWGIDELLENIIRRIDYLFSIEFGTIYVRNDQKVWELKASASDLSDEEDKVLSDFERFIELDANDIKTIDLSELKRDHLPFDDNVQKLIISPLVSEQSIVAVMIIGTKGNMKSGDLNILKMFKNQASIVIQRSILYDELRKQYFSTIEALVNVIEAKDKYTEGHSRRVSRFSVEIATEIGYSNEDVESIEISGLLHDVGKVGINQNILNKIGKLTDEEYEIVKEHPEKGIQILQSIKFDHKITDGIQYHHVRYDLKGYPENHGLDVLPPYAAIIGVADAFDAMTSARSYTKPRSIKDAMIELDNCSGAQFDPEIVKAFHRVLEHKPERIQTIVDDIRS